jgi:hypothetical protein
MKRPYVGLLPQGNQRRFTDKHLAAALAAAALVLAVAGGAGEARAGAAGCDPGPRSVRGFQTQVFCGPATAKLIVNRKAFTIENGVCERHTTYFLVNIGTVVSGLGLDRPKLPYFGLVVGRSPAYPDPVVNKPGTYRKGSITVDGPGVQVDLHNEADLKIVLGAGLRSGRFSATKPGSAIYGTPAYKVSGTFSC